MTNDYFNHASPLTKHTLARAAQVNAVFDAIVAGLDKLPGADPLNQGRVTYVADTGAADAYVVSLSKAPSAYTVGLSIVMKAANTNTGASTINVNSLGVKSIKRYNGDDTVANDIVAGALIHLVYDGTNFRIVGANGAEAALAKKWATSTSAVSGGLKGARGYAQDASASASAAATSETNAQGHYETFLGVFYGALASDPATDPNGDPLNEGDWYYNTTTKVPRIFDGSVFKDIGSARLTTFVFTATGGETSLSGADDNGNTLAYTVDFIQLHKNGALLTPDDDYTADDGTSITGLPAATAGDVYVIDAFSTLDLADVYTKAEIDAYDPEHATDSGTDAYVSAENTTAPGAGKKTVRDFQSANTTTTPTLDGRTITDIAGNALWAEALNRVHDLLDDGTNYRVLNPSMEGGWRHRIEHVKDHGAAVDGTTNDTVELQAALNAAANGDGHVYMPRGTHLLGSITIPLDVVLELSPYAVIKPVASLSGDLIMLAHNAVFEGGMVDCTGQSFTGDVWVFDPTPNVSGDTGRLQRAVRNTAAKGDQGAGNGRVFVLEALNDGDALFKVKCENVKSEGFDTFIRMEADNPGAGQVGYVNSNLIKDCWANACVTGLSQDSNGSAGQIDANMFVNFGFQWQSMSTRALIIGGRWQEFINTQIWDADPADTAIQFDSQSDGNHVEGYLGDGGIINGGANNSVIDLRSPWRKAKVRHASFNVNFGTIAAGGISSNTTSIGFGAKGTDFLVVQPNPALHQDLVLTYRLQADGEVLIKVKNEGGGGIDPGDTAFHCYVFSNDIHK